MRSARPLRHRRRRAQPEGQQDFARHQAQKGVPGEAEAEAEARGVQVRMTVVAGSAEGVEVQWK